MTACGRANEIDLACAVFVPQINVEYKHGMVNIIAVYLLSGSEIGDDKPYAGRWCNWPSILVTEAAHTGSSRLLDYIEVVLPTRKLVALREWNEHTCRPNLLSLGVDQGTE